MNDRSSSPGERLANRLLWLAGLLSVLLIAVVVNAVLHGGSGGLDPVAAAAERTAAMPGARMALDVVYHVEGESGAIEGHGGGAYNARTGHSAAYLTLPISTEPMTVHSIADEQDVYYRAPTLNPALPPGKKWMQIELLLGHLTVTGFSANGGAGSTIDALKAVGGNPEQLGRETVRGHSTTRYRDTIEFSREAQVVREGGAEALARQLERLAEKVPGEIPIEAWIDDRGLARKIRIVEPLPEAAGGRVLTMDMTIELFDFGVEPKIDLPAPDTVLDYTPVARAELQMLTGESNASLIAATPPELSAAEFRRRGLAVCADIRAEVESLTAAVKKAMRAFKPSWLSPAESLAGAREWATHFYDPVARLERRILKPLAALGPPSDVAATYRVLLHRLALDAEARQAQALALEAGSFAVYSQVQREFFTHDFPEEEALWRQVGLGDCLSGQPETAAAGTSAA
jgi:hypothetical protein